MTILQIQILKIYLNFVFDFDIQLKERYFSKKKYDWHNRQI